MTKNTTVENLVRQSLRVNKKFCMGQEYNQLPRILLSYTILMTQKKYSGHFYTASAGLYSVQGGGYMSAKKVARPLLVTTMKIYVFLPSSQEFRINFLQKNTV